MKQILTNIIENIGKQNIAILNNISCQLFDYIYKKLEIINVKISNY